MKSADLPTQARAEVRTPVETRVRVPSDPPAVCSPHTPTLGRSLR